MDNDASERLGHLGAMLLRRAGADGHLFKQKTNLAFRLSCPVGAEAFLGAATQGVARDAVSPWASL
jgi:hypothetical protein